MKIIYSIAVAGLLAFSCNNNKEVVSEEKPEAAASEHVKLVNAYFEHFNKHEWEKMAAMYTETAEFKDPSLGKTAVTQTRAQTAKKYAELAQIFKDIKDSVVAVYPSGNDHVIVEFVSTGTAPDATKLNLPICTIFTFENGLISKDYTYYDEVQ